MKTPKTDTSERKVYIPKFLAQILVDIKKEQDELKDILGSVAPPISALISVLPLFVT